jgi:PTH1 family peptidyl-tRNA hydrolase
MAGADAMALVRLVAGWEIRPRACGTRHNAGFWFADGRLELGAAFRSEQVPGPGGEGAGDLRLLKPMTYMNLSGRSVSAAARFFGITPGEILVVHDELDLLPGEAKMKFGGGIAGHNGLRDVAGQLGTPDFWRLRIGIGHPRDSAIPQQDVADYVLAPPAGTDAAAIVAAIDRAIDAWPAIAAGDFERAMLLLHTKKEKS